MESLQKRLQIIDYFDALVNKLDLAVENYYVNRRLSSARSPKIELVRAECIHELNEMKHKCLQTGDFVCSCIFLETKSTGHDMFDGVLLIFEDSPLDALISLTDIERGYCSNKWFTENDLCVISSRENQAVIRWEFCNTKLTSPLIKTTNAEFFSGGDLIIHMFSDNKRNLPPVITKKGLEFFTKYRLKEASFFADINLFVNFNTLFDYKNLDIVLATLNLVKSCASSVAEETAIFFEIFVANADPQLKILFFRLINSYELSNLTRAWFTWRFRRSLLKLPTDQFASAKYLKERITGKRPSIIQFDGKRPSHACKVIKNRGICRHLPFGFVRASSIVELAITIDESNLERFQSVCWKSLKRLHLLQDYDKEEEMHRQPPLPVGPRMFNKMPTLDTLIITHSADFQCFPQYNSQYSHPFEHISKTLRNLSILSNYPYKTDIDFCCAPIFADLPNDTSITCEFETNTYYDPVEDIGRYDNVLCYIKNITISENSYKYTVLCADYSVLSSPAQLNRCVANKIIYPFYSKHSRNTPLSLIWTSALRDLEEVKIQDFCRHWWGCNDYQVFTNETVKISIHAVKLKRLVLINNRFTPLMEYLEYPEPIVYRSKLTVPLVAPNLNLLELNDCSIIYIKPGVFSHLSNLRTLNLDENRLEKLEYNTFDGLVRVQEISLRNNCIMHIDCGTFAQLQDLKSLTLISNHPDLELSPQMLPKHMREQFAGIIK